MSEREWVEIGVRDCLSENRRQGLIVSIKTYERIFIQHFLEPSPRRQPDSDSFLSKDIDDLFQCRKTEGVPLFLRAAEFV